MVYKWVLEGLSHHPGVDLRLVRDLSGQLLNLLRTLLVLTFQFVVVLFVLMLQFFDHVSQLLDLFVMVFF
jgi:hypothetical protein